MRRIVVVICVQFFSLTVSAQTYDSCLSLYLKADYAEVKNLYESDKQLSAIVYDSITLFDAVTTSYINLGEYTTAKKLLQSFQSRHTTEGASLTTALVLNNLGLIYDALLDYDSALYCLNQGLKIRSRKVLANDPLLAESYFNLGSLFSKMGDYDKAEDLLTKTLAIDLKNYEANDPVLAMTLNNLAVVNEDCGRFSKALDYYRRASTIFAINPGRKSFQYGLLQFNKAKVFLKLDQVDSANKHFISANEILNQANIFLPEVGMLQIELINHMIQRTQLNEAEALLQKTEQKWKSNTDAWKYMRPDLLLSEGKLRLHQGRTEDAMKSVQLAKKAYAEVYKTTNIRITNVLDFEASVYFRQKRYGGYQESYRSMHQLLLNKITSMFPSFSEKEREQFFFKVKPHFEKYASLLLTDSQTKGVTGQLYNNQLATKGILLNYTNRWKRQILSSGDIELIKSFARWQEMKTQLQEESDKTFKRAFSIDSLEEQANALEKRLSSRSELFARHIDHPLVKWQTIRDSLKKNEAAIEIIRFRKFDYETSQDFTNDIYYAALIITKQTKEDPQLVLFRNGAELETRILKQYRNSILFKQTDLSSYAQLWKPIGEKLKGINKVYFSPDGIFNLINFNTLKNPATGKFLLEEIHIRQVTNTKDLLSPLTTEAYNNYALLFGGPDYTSKAKQDGKALRSFTPTFRTYPSLKFVRGKSLTFLPGAKKEVEDIRDLMETNQWNVDLFEGENALEENLKHSLKPKLLHIATHGYFQQDTGYDLNQRGGENLLHQSGLMFAGAANSIDEPDEITDMSYQEDGVLTAYEAMNLNLENTELVVLSACDTGLGEIQNGEGVYGLQRAFRVAGARNLIMSLWKVDDEVTSLLMKTFYADWLKTGDKYRALTRTQLTIKAKYPDPYYWGAFILVGN